LYPFAGGAPKYYEQDGWIRELNGRAAFIIRGQEVHTLSGEKVYSIKRNSLHRTDSGYAELFFGD
jgi:hypothetical protein